MNGTYADGPMSETATCPKCRKAGAPFIEPVIKRGRASGVFFCFECGHQWTDGASTGEATERQPHERHPHARDVGRTD